MSDSITSFYIKKLNGSNNQLCDTLCNKVTSDADNTLLKLILYKISRSNVPAVGQPNRCGSPRLPNSPKYSTVKYSLS